MKLLRKFQEKHNKERKRDVILKWMASFSVTVIVVASVVVQQQKENPSVSFDKITAVGTTIVYQTMIIDPSATIVEDSLLLEVSSAYERHELPLTLGLNSGTFSMRYAQSEYMLAVKGSQGFGATTLASQSVRAKMQLSGAITSYTLLNDSEEDMLHYQVSTLYLDPELTMDSLQLRFGYLENYWAHDPSAVPDNDLIFPIHSIKQTIDLPEVPNENYTIFLTLEGIKKDNTPVIFDTVRFKTPLKIYGDLYVDDLGPQYLSVYPYVSEHNLRKEEVSVHLYEGEIRRQTKVMTLMPSSSSSQEQEPYHESTPLRFDGLKQNTPYHLALVIQYQDEISGKRIDIELATLEVSTTAAYQTSLSHNTEGFLVYLTLVINDPSMVLSDFSFTAYEHGVDYPIYLGSGSFEVESTNGGVTTYIATVDKMAVSVIEIEIYATKTAATIQYSYCLLYKISV